MSDEIILVNMNDDEIGCCEKMEAHRIPALHRAFSVFLYKKEGGKLYMLLQKRAEGKYHSGGLWTNACCSHPRKGETLAEAVSRRMAEELGMAADVEEEFAFTYFHRFSEDCAEFEYDHVFSGKWEGEVRPNPEEISQVAWMEFSDIEQKMMAQPDGFSPWFMIAAPKVMAVLRDREQ